LKTFRLTEEEARITADLAKNQGLYNGFLAAGCLWAIVDGTPLATSISLFFVWCIIVAGIVGSMTVNKRILFVQCFPAILTLSSLVAFDGVSWMWHLPCAAVGFVFGYWRAGAFSTKNLKRTPPK